MKKIFLGLAVAAGSLAFGQQFGVKAGANFASLSDDGDFTNKSKTGFYAGVFMNAPLGENFSIQPEILYSDKGAKTTIANNAASYTTNLGYISVPVMFQYNFVPQFYLEAGPEFNFLVNASQKDVVGNTSNMYKVSIDNYKGFDFGIGVGAGYYFIPQLGITARYVAGMTSVGKEYVVAGQTISSNNMKNNIFQVGLAYKF